MSDYLDDLADFPSQKVQTACEEYRRTPGNEFFPKICQLLEILKPPRRVWEDQGPRLPAYRRSDFMLEGPKPSQSVGDILRKHGHAAAADKFDARKESKTETKGAFNDR